MNMVSMLEKILVDWDSSEYFELISKNLDSSISKSKELHHILPKSLFPEFSNLKENPWNGVYLSFSNHFKAHFFLAKSKNFSMICAFRMMHNSDKHFDRFENNLSEESKLYSDLRKDFCDKMAASTKELWLNSEFRKSQSEGLKKALATDSAKSMMAVRSKEQWACQAFKEAQSIGLKNNYRKKFTINEFGAFDKDTGALIKTFNYIPDAVEFIGKTAGSARSHIRACLNGKIKFSYGYIWRFL